MITAEEESRWGRFKKCKDCRKQFKKKPYNFQGLPCKVAYQTGYGFIKGPETGSDADNSFTCESYKPDLKTLMKELPSQLPIFLRSVLSSLPR